MLTPGLQTRQERMLPERPSPTRGSNDVIQFGLAARLDRVGRIRCCRLGLLFTHQAGFRSSGLSADALSMPVFPGRARVAAFQADTVHTVRQDKAAPAC